MIVADEREETGVEVRDVVEFEMGVSGRQRCNGRIETGCVTKPGVFVTRSHQSRDIAAGTTVLKLLQLLPIGLAGDRLSPGDFGLHHSSGVDFGTCDMTVHIDSTGHHDATTQVDGPIQLRVVGDGNDFAVLDPKVLDLPFDAIGRIVDFPTRQFQYARIAHHLIIAIRPRAVFLGQYLPAATRPDFDLGPGNAPGLYWRA